MSRDIWAVPLQLNNFNIVLALLGGFISLFGLVSFLLKENYYLSEARKLLFDPDLYATGLRPWRLKTSWRRSSWSRTLGGILAESWLLTLV